MDDEKNIVNEESNLSQEKNFNLIENSKEIETKEEGEKLDVTANKNSKYKILIIGIVLGMIVCGGVIINTTVSKYENKVYPGISIYGEDLSKLDKNGVYRVLGQVEKEISEKAISVKASKSEYNLKIKDLIKDYSKDKLASEIIEYGKNGNILENFFKIINQSNKDYKFDIKIDEDNIEETLSKIGEETNVSSKEPKVVINGDKIEYIDGKDGLVLNKKQLYIDLLNSIKEINNVEKNIEIQAKYKKESPKISINDLKKVDTKVSEYSTHYGVGGGRGRNIENATKKLDDLILMPGDEFSYEKTIGPVVASNGYSNAPVIINGSLKDGIGGGVCQVSSTLYNAQLKAGLLPTERRNHSKPVNYVPRGLDATLASGIIDYKFKNTYIYPIVLNTYTYKGSIYTEIWSNKEVTKGIIYDPVSYVSGNIANSYLYGYDKTGKKVYEKHIDASIYR